ncbi:MAG: membrane integrity-associated transporter subunit PqiC [Deltaproteobacteria bacterium]|nr:membrane integrity-associated transporter subunit PqiC [Deltaproteobacteria bacterium]MBW2016269.1 membrane integrity-associated transporter subunit PqiC [Deltaproteobacteria bacterium]MBW2128551.1 membrane integrity-associated transporter subunit PqiC [Deltaproteobacteria bacterium]MBW2303325.1 membrane integrity-associated transporter subunit PqiC [Deltaproteobacteria bacterium]
MNRVKRIKVIIVGLFLLLPSCLGLEQPSNKVDYYTLEYPPPRLEGLRPLECVVRVQRFSVAAPYNRIPIVYRDKAFRRQTYHYHKWRANPGDLVSSYLQRDLKSSGLFKAVLPYDSKGPSDYLLEGSVDEFFEWDTGETWKAVLTLSVALIADREPNIQRGVIFQKTYREEQPCKDRTPEAVAEAMSGAMARIAERILRDLYGHMHR